MSDINSAQISAVEAVFFLVSETFSMATTVVSLYHAASASTADIWSVHCSECTKKYNFRESPNEVFTVLTEQL